jgi:2-keto-4-pentenoate hydratase/2-oxohepta-3-ene-1,7-dioic acid hydratase in catechol pathway
MGTDVQRFVRFQQGTRTGYARLEDNRLHGLRGGIFGIHAYGGDVLSLDAVELKTPCVPSKILCVGLNYASHLGDRPVPERPEIFVVPPSAQLDPGGTIVLPGGTNQVQFEGELVVVIGKRARDLTDEQAREHILGVTCGNDVSARDWQRNDLQWWRAKGCDTFAPFGPVIACGLDYEDLLLTTRLNGAVTQQQRTSDMIFSPAHIVSFISRHMTLYPGDIIYTGTPGSTAPMQAGDVVEVEIEGVGVLRNPVGKND